MIPSASPSADKPVRSRFRPRGRSARCLALAAAGVLSACAEGWVSWDQVSDVYSVGTVNAAVHDGALPAAVFGRPEAGLGEAAVLASLRPPATIAADRLVADSKAVTRVVLIFEPAPMLAGAALCDGGRAGTVAGTGAGQTLTVLAALCVGTKDVSSAQAGGPAAAWRSFVQQALIAILPASHSVDRNSIDIPTP